MDEWDEYYKKPSNNSDGNVWDRMTNTLNNNSNGAQNQQSAYRAMYQSQMNNQNKYYVNGDNMAPETYNACFVDTTATTNLNKWLKVFKVFCIVLFVILIIYGLISGYNTANTVEKVASPYYPDGKYVEKFDLAVFIGFIIGYGIGMFVYFLIYKLLYAAFSCLAQNTRSAGISAKLAAFNTRNQMMKDANKDNENKIQ